MTGVAVSKAIHSEKPALRVTWTTPQSDVPISQYQVEYRRSGTNWRAASPVSPGSTTSTLLEALDAGTVYEVRIRAVSAIGNGTWSEVQAEVTYMGELCSEFKLVEMINIELKLYPCTSMDRDCHVFPHGLWTGHVYYRNCMLLHGHTVKWPFTTTVNSAGLRRRWGCII